MKAQALGSAQGWLRLLETCLQPGALQPLSRAPSCQGLIGALDPMQMLPRLHGVTERLKMEPKRVCLVGPLGAPERHIHVLPILWVGGCGAWGTSPVCSPPLGSALQQRTG